MFVFVSVFKKERQKKLAHIIFKAFFNIDQRVAFGMVLLDCFLNFLSVTQDRKTHTLAYCRFVSVTLKNDKFFLCF